MFNALATVVNNQAYVETAFFTQNDLLNNILKIGMPYVEHYLYQ